MLVAGVDVGNSTTEIAVARVEPGADPDVLLVLRQPTSGAKGSAASAEGVVALLDRAARRLAGPITRVLLAEQHPVETGLVELGRLEELDLGGVAVARPASATPSGCGVGVGELMALDALAAAPHGRPVIPIVVRRDFEEAAAALRSARERGWRLAGAIVDADDGVLVGNRLDRSLPILDEVADAAALPTGVLAAIEVGPPGGAVEQLSDPLRLAVLLGLAPDAARAARHAARAVAGHRSALVVLAAPTGRRRNGAVASEPTVALVLPDGSQIAVEQATVPPLPGRGRRLVGAITADAIDDAFWCPLPAPPEEAALRRRLAHRRAVGLAYLRTTGGADLLAALDGRAAEVVARESEAAVLGAATTPGAGTTPFVLDLGGGTVDLHRNAGPDEQVVVAAGAGELVTRICGGLLGCDGALAERAKRGRSARVETPFVLHHEDGSRSFLGEPAPPGSVGRLALLAGRELVPLPAPLAPEVWRGLRRAAKRAVLATNVRRALDAAGGVPRGELVTLVGGCASDPEVVDEVAATLADLDVAVARGDVLGRHGPRAAVAVGLVLAGTRRRR